MLALGAAAGLLAGCAAEDTSDTPNSEATADGSGEAANGALSAVSLEMAETAWLSISEEGEVFTTYLDPDGRYRDERGGTRVYSGTWEQNPDRELCFSPETGEGECWAHGAPGLDGVMRATSASGREIEVRRVTYQPADPVEGSDEPALDDAATDEPESASADARG
ncbi:MAG: hypothetical protein AAF291_06545 [Pseudomonadota bacterium]